MPPQLLVSAEDQGRRSAGRRTRASPPVAARYDALHATGAAGCVYKGVKARFRMRIRRWFGVRMAAAALGTSLLLGGCDPTLRATVENGIINSSTAALGSVFAAMLQLFQEARADEGGS